MQYVKFNLLLFVASVMFFSCKQHRDQPYSVSDKATTTLQPIDQRQQAYYKDIDFTLQGEELKKQLADLITKTHQPQKYTPNAWEVLKSTDFNPSAPDELILIYSHPKELSTRKATASTISKTMANRKGINDHTRENYYEREHVFAKSLAKPKLNTYADEKQATAQGLIAGTDMHNLRAANGAYNNERGNRKFTDNTTSELSHAIGQQYWYPGSQWKGDVARMMMYMYLRYGKQCAPELIGTGPLVATVAGKDKEMLVLFLKWNAQDPVSEIETRRNNYHGDNKNQYAQGNRNPFIDNPYLANLIWADQTTTGFQGQNTWQ